MSKKCVNCGQPLAENASFCPHCATVQTEKKTVKAPKRWRKKAVAGVILLVVVALIGVAFSVYHRPKTYGGDASIEYPDGDTSYKVLLAFSANEGMTGHATGERTDTLAEGMGDMALPCQLYVLDQGSGKLAGEEFSEKIASCKVDTKPAKGSQKMEYTEPMYNEDFANAAYTSDIMYTADSGTNDIQWTLTMKNGDVLTLSTRLSIEKLTAVTYSAKDTPMETTEELKALLDDIDANVEVDRPVRLYLPAVTYDGDITFGDHAWGIYGSIEGDAVTTFTGTVSIKGQNGNYAELSDITFKGTSGIGLDAYCLVDLSECSFDGWDTAAIAQDGAWISARDSSFTNNGVGLKFNSTMSYGTAPDYVNNIFTGNKVAVCIDALPGEEILDFAGSTFSGNETDIDNKAQHTIDTARAIFE